jgi:hypothetical protein
MSGGAITLNDWQIKEIRSVCNLFVEVKFCKKVQNEIAQLEAFANSIGQIYPRKEEMVEKLISTAPGLRDYLIVHAEPKPGIVIEDDWLAMKLVNFLKPSDSDIERIYKKQPVPQYVLDKLSIFDPEPVGFEKDAIRIEYGFYGKGDPLNVIDTAWEQITYDSVNVERVLASFTPIEAGAPELNSMSFENDELPF